MRDPLTDAELKVYEALRFLDDISNSPSMMGYQDIERLGEASQRLGEFLGLDFNERTGRYTKESKVK